MHRIRAGGSAQSTNHQFSATTRSATPTLPQVEDVISQALLPSR